MTRHARPFVSLLLRASLACCLLVPLTAGPARADAQGDALLGAAYEGDLKRVEALVRRGVSLKAADENGYTALHWAAYMGNARLVTLLLDHDAWPQARDRDGCTPLMLAAARGHAAVVALLLALGADPLLRSRDGFTALDYARATPQGAPARAALEAVSGHHDALGAPANPGAPRREVARFALYEGTTEIDPAAFIGRVSPVAPALAPRLAAFAPANDARAVGFAGLAVLSSGAALAAVSLKLASGADAGQQPLMQGAGTTGLVLAGLGALMTAGGFGGAWLLHTARPFSYEEALSAIEAYNRRYYTRPELTVVPLP